MTHTSSCRFTQVKNKGYEKFLSGIFLLDFYFEALKVCCGWKWPVNECGLESLWKEKDLGVPNE